MNPKNEIEKIFDPINIRIKSKSIYNKCLNGETFFKLNLEKLDQAANYLFDVIKTNYPDLKIPYHCRNNHFNVGGVNRVLQLKNLLKDQSTKEQILSFIDLNIISVLVDAGAGDTWKYLDEKSNKYFNRSEGLAVASFNAFINGQFSHHSKLEVSGEKLINFELEEVNDLFQVKKDNKLEGIEGRLNLINSLGKSLTRFKETFPNQRPSDAFIQYIDQSQKIDALKVFHTIIYKFGNIWPNRIEYNDINLGDTWKYNFIKEPINFSDNLISFHKLSQWLTYSILAIFGEYGYEIQNIDLLTGLPEYRNGGFFVDSGLIELRETKNYEKSFEPNHELIIEWRALTICLIDLIYPKILEKLNLTKDTFTLPQLLEGGTWSAGRKIAPEKRGTNNPPISIISDGTVF